MDEQNVTNRGVSGGRPTERRVSAILVSSLGLLVIVTLLVFIFSALFPKSYWQSRELYQNLARWERRHITHYSMSILVAGYGINSNRMPLTIEVQNEKVISVVDAAGLPVTASDGEYQYAFTMSGVFSYAEQHIQDHPALINIAYNSAMGYPSTVYIDPFSEPCCQDYGLSVQDFHILAP